ncbi:hypothetical protein EIP91_003775 [Steccherinum ochraceum]|uniref:Glutaminase A n=1 Tax=Steccherinum ochraceum TaxID=92696 RepID=A0A4R0RA02_9APHY|nr:hypothetical protein EIP91_003775 [Steccherinum ochraceum]
MFSRSLAFTLLSLLSFFFPFVASGPAWTSDPFIPPAIPLAVRSPYLSAWLPQGQGTALNAGWATFWTGMIQGWAGYIKVDGKAYAFMGSAGGVTSEKAVQKSFQFTSTQSTFVLTAGPVDLTVTFLSPVEPDDLVKQSFPFSYMSMTVASNDGASHFAKVYTDISAEWITGNVSSLATWKATTDSNVVTHQIQLSTQVPYTEDHDKIQNGAAYFSATQTSGLTYQIGQDVLLRNQFTANGTLLNTQDTNFRAVQDEWPVFAFAWNLGKFSSTSATVVCSLGHVRDPAVQYIKADGSKQDRSLYFWSKYSTVAAAIADFLQDYTNALSRAKALDATISTDAKKVSQDYAELTALSLRQAFGASEITVSKNADGSFNTSDVLIFTKETSSSASVNTVDAIYSMWPLYLYMNATMGKYALLPGLEYSASGLYKQQFAVHDLGSHYPQATGLANGGLTMPIEETGNMLIMVLSYIQRTGDTSLATQYHSLLDQWAQYLQSNALNPTSQMSSDAFAGALDKQTNLAIKGAIGIAAMSEIANLTGDATKAAQYASTAVSFASKIVSSGTSTDGQHLTLSVSFDRLVAARHRKLMSLIFLHWGLAYNLYADQLLGTNLFPDTVYNMQTSWYGNKLANTQYGLPLDTRHTYSLTHWEIWAAAIAGSSTVRDSFIGGVLKLATNGKSNKPFGDWYDTVAGTENSFTARPVVGGHFALLALQGAPLNTTGIVAPTSTQITLTQPTATPGAGGGGAPPSPQAAASDASRASVLHSFGLGVVFILSLSLLP